MIIIIIIIIIIIVNLLSSIKFSALFLYLKAVAFLKINYTAKSFKIILVVFIQLYYL